MKNIKLVIALIWQSFLALISPAWIGLICLFVTGNGKGYGHDLGSEADIYVMFGVIGIIAWVTAVLPVSIWLGKTFYHKQKRLWIIPVVLFILVFAMAVMMMGLKNFLYAFGIY